MAAFNDLQTAVMKMMRMSPVAESSALLEIQTTYSNPSRNSFSRFKRNIFCRSVVTAVSIPTNIGQEIKICACLYVL